MIENVAWELNDFSCLSCRRKIPQFCWDWIGRECCESSSDKIRDSLGIASTFPIHKPENFPLNDRLASLKNYKFNSYSISES